MTVLKIRRSFAPVTALGLDEMVEAFLRKKIPAVVGHGENRAMIPTDIDNSNLPPFPKRLPEKIKMIRERLD